MARSTRPTQYYVHTIPGIEGVTWDEVQEVVTPVSLEGFKSVPGRNGMVLFATRAGPDDLIKLRTAEDLFHTVARISDVPWGREGMARIYNSLARGVSLNHGLNLLGSIRPMRTQQQVTYRVITRVAGKNQPYRRIDLTRAIESAIKTRTRKRWKAVPNGEQVELWANLLGRELVMGMRLSDESMRHRPYQEVHLPASLRPSMAAAMARLTDPRPDDVFLDPLCGTGTILIERDFAGPHGLMLGGDIDWAALSAAQQNIGPRHKPRELVLWDARYLPVADNSVDCVASNLPFGRQLSRPSALPELYAGIVAELYRVMHSGSRGVLLTGAIKVLRTALHQQGGFRLGRAYSVSLLGRPATIQLVERAH